MPTTRHRRHKFLTLIVCVFLAAVWITTFFGYVAFGNKGTTVVFGCGVLVVWTGFQMAPESGWVTSGTGFCTAWLPEYETLGNQPGAAGYVMPLWMPLVPLGVLTAWLWWRDRPLPAGHCQKCGYDLTGDVSGVCPECGTEVKKP
jgi:hypothetical protein